MTDNRELYTASDLADRANVSASYVARMCRQGKIRATKLGRTWVIRAEDAEEWLSQRSEDHPTEH